jgi:hypothetical protein
MLFLIDETVVSQCKNGTLKQGLQNHLRTFIARFGFYFKIVGLGRGCRVPYPPLPPLKFVKGNCQLGPCCFIGSFVLS